MAEASQIWSDIDNDFMDLAIKTVRDQLDLFGEYPAEGCVVGCVVVKDRTVVGIGVTAKGGRPHAEAVALEMAGDSAIGADVYVTLEPCAHQSARGASCAGALVEAGVKRVVACLQDPDPRTAGSGFARLQAAGIICEIGLKVSIGEELIVPFLARFPMGSVG
jgi:diaminohydroxyphosphoribosylaminopyrimidine deaminase / 5-amino-6-(5-phosphoribosylamino)uracil reductase